MRRSIDNPAPRVGSDRLALRRRIKSFYARFNRGDWSGCHALIDPSLTGGGKVDRSIYSDQLNIFRDAYKVVNPWMIRLSFHLDISKSQQGKRPFAYVYLIWHDETYGYHMFRERWVNNEGLWFTRVVGLVPNRQVASTPSD